MIERIFINKIIYIFNQGLGRFYSIDDSTEQRDENADRHYAELLHLYGDADEWARKQQSKEFIKTEVKKDNCKINK